MCIGLEICDGQISVLDDRVKCIRLLAMKLGREVDFFFALSSCFR
jgi:hypothetical protein